MIEPTKSEIEAAASAYVDARYKGEASNWQKAYPVAWAEICERMKAALEAAAKVRNNGQAQS
jgi:hypothetical protein